jgi:hypothetical protein
VAKVKVTLIVDRLNGPAQAPNWHPLHALFGSKACFLYKHIDKEMQLTNSSLIVNEAKTKITVPRLNEI